jgi:hypothetical protein
MCLKTLVLQKRLVGGKELARKNFHSGCTVYLILHALPLQHLVDGALGRHRNTREPAKQTLTDFANTPAGALTLDVQDVVFYLERKLVGIAIRATASVRQPMNAAFLVTIEEIFSGFQ